MFDPKQWQVYQFQDVELIPQNERRIIEMVLALQQVVAITTIFCNHGDASDQEFELTWDPGTVSSRARLFQPRDVPAGVAINLYPEMPSDPQHSKATMPLLLSGPGTFRVTQLSTMSNPPGAVLQVNLHWFQAKFAGKASDEIVPTGTTVP